MWTYEVVVAAAPVRAHRILTAPATWFAFYPLYQGLVHADADWPAVGSSITVAVGWDRRLRARLRQTVLSHQSPQRLLLAEEALGGIWSGRPEFLLSEVAGGGSRIVLMVRPSSRHPLLRPIVRRVGDLFDESTQQAMVRLRRMIDQPADTP